MTARGATEEQEQIAPMRLDVCVAHNQGGIGHLRMQGLEDELARAESGRRVACIITRAVVDADTLAGKAGTQVIPGRMRCRLALLTLLGALCACDAPPRDTKPAQPVVREKAPAPAPSKEQRAERSGQCEQLSRGRFRRDWQEGTARSADGQMTADFTSHYNAKLDACFYLLTLSQSANAAGQGGAAAGTVRKMLFDIDTAELYGEYLGPAADGSPADGFPATCRLEALHCGSRREWEVLLERYMQD